MIYDINSILCQNAYDINYISKSVVYTIDKDAITLANIFEENISISTCIAASQDPPEYLVVRINKTKKDGTKQYPFVRWNRDKALNISKNEGWSLVINAGLGVSDEQPIDGVLIENGRVVNNDPATHHLYTQPMTIDSNGDLSYALSSATGNELTAQGITNACNGFCPIIVDGQKCDIPNVSIGGGGNHFKTVNPRQIFGQFENGDYCVVSQQGRQLPTPEEIQLSASQGLTLTNNDIQRKGWTLATAQNICKDLGLKFAYCLDGGQSVATIVNGQLLTPNTPIFFIKIDGTIPANRINGRTIPSFIVFNGTTQFNIPSAS